MLFYYFFNVNLSHVQSHVKLTPRQTDRQRVSCKEVWIVCNSITRFSSFHVFLVNRKKVKVANQTWLDRVSRVKRERDGDRQSKRILRSYQQKKMFLYSHGIEENCAVHNYCLPAKLKLQS